MNDGETYVIGGRNFEPSAVAGPAQETDSLHRLEQLRRDFAELPAAVAAFWASRKETPLDHK